MKRGTMITTELNLPKEKKDEFGYTKSQNRQIEKYLTSPRYRPETTMERINRIGYEHGEKGFEKKPKHTTGIIFSCTPVFNFSLTINF